MEVCLLCSFTSTNCNPGGSRGGRDCKRFFPSVPWVQQSIYIIMEYVGMNQNSWHVYILKCSKVCSRFNISLYELFQGFTTLLMALGLLESIAENQNCKSLEEQFYFHLFLAMLVQHWLKLRTMRQKDTCPTRYCAHTTEFNCLPGTEVQLSTSTEIV